MDDRRGFLAKLLGAGALTIAPLTELQSQVADRMTYKGFTIQWTGWKESPCQDILVGQWCASRHRGFWFYASYPGGEGWYTPGMYFDLSIKDSQEPVFNLHTPEEKEKFRLDALQRLIKVIDEHRGREYPNL